VGDWLLFYGGAFPKEAREAIDQLRSIPVDLKKQYSDLKRESTVETAEISVRVKMGQIVEQIVPGLPTFPYARNDCRSLFKPIDYMVFEGLTKGSVNSVHFLDVKTGNAGMTPHEKQVKRVVEKKHVEFTRY